MIAPLLLRQVRIPFRHRCLKTYLGRVTPCPKVRTTPACRFERRTYPLQVNFQVHGEGIEPPLPVCKTGTLPLS